jgi:hypothetical protein
MHVEHLGLPLAHPLRRYVYGIRKISRTPTRDTSNIEIATAFG